MITEVLGLAGTGAAGAAFGMMSDAIHGSREYKLKQLTVEIERERSRNAATTQYLDSESGFATTPAYSFAFVLLTASYCACALICFIWPDVNLVTFNPSSEPKEINVLWGLISYTLDPTKTYNITTGGCGLSLLYPMAFQIGTVITGISPMKRGS